MKNKINSCLILNGDKICLTIHTYTSRHTHKLTLIEDDRIDNIIWGSHIYE
jgi:hypothetical protein